MFQVKNVSVRKKNFVTLLYFSDTKTKSSVCKNRRKKERTRVNGL